jgi:hypothetical protein
MVLAVTAILFAPVGAGAEGPIGAWVPGPPMTELFDYHSALLLKDGRVMILASRAEVKWSQRRAPGPLFAKRAFVRRYRTPTESSNGCGIPGRPSDQAT